VSTLPRPRAATPWSGATQPLSELVLGRYKLLEQIGSGGHGTVWVARDQEQRMPVAVKRVPMRGDDPRERQRAQREGRAAARLEHPAIVALLATGEDALSYYLVSELVEGSSLAAIYRSGGLPDRALLAIGSALTQALEHAHERGVVHRDVKPQNVIVPARVEAGETPAKLTDFGIARLAGEQALTNTGDIIGTFEYMAPEQAQGRPAGPPADLYALALTLYEGLAGANPLRGATVAATAQRIGAAIPPLASCRRDLPPRLCQALDRALDTDPARRGTLAQLRAALEEARGAGARRHPLVRMPGLRSRRGLSAALVPTARARLIFAAASAGVSGGVLASVLGAANTTASVFAGTLVASLVTIASGVAWMLAALTAIAWLGAAGHPGSALLLAAALAPVPLLLGTRPWLWSAPILAPLLGLAGAAACAPALAGSLARRALPRAALGALCYWWLALAETLFHRRLLLGLAPHVAPPSAWQNSLTGAVSHALVPLCTDGRLLSAGLWALAAMALPWALRARSLAWRSAAAVLWSGVLMVALAEIATSQGEHRSPLTLAAVALAAALALAGSLLRAPPHERPDVA
jgi:hypothetical protein